MSKAQNSVKNPDKNSDLINQTSTYGDYNNDDDWLKSAKLKQTDDEFIQFLRKEDRISGMINLRKVRQKLYACSQIWKYIPQDFKEKWKLEEQHFMGLEWIMPGEMLDPHIDIGGRKSNIIINIGEHPATVMHSNNDVLENVTIEPGDYFVLDTTKTHGCDNTNSEHIAEFLTVNRRMTYQECIALF
tara:strand:- start:599 stop:1159 length:561 start_codon:yes stop_codon:yes gene_type:complete